MIVEQRQRQLEVITTIECNNILIMQSSAVGVIAIASKSGNDVTMLVGNSNWMDQCESGNVVELMYNYIASRWQIERENISWKYKNCDECIISISVN